MHPPGAIRALDVFGIGSSMLVLAPPVSLR
jgi:hypothetical protein